MSRVDIHWQKNEFLNQLTQKFLVLLLEWSPLSIGLCDPLSWPLRETAMPIVLCSPSEVDMEEDGLLGAAWLYSLLKLIHVVFIIMSKTTIYIVIQVKMVIRNHFSPSRLEEIKNFDNTLCWQGCASRHSHIYADGSINSNYFPGGQFD